jgi:hypothetical protein
MLFSCTEDYEIEEIVLPNGNKIEVKYKRVLHDSNTVKDVYLNGKIFRLAKRYESSNQQVTERWWWYSNGEIKDYKCYQNNNLTLYSRYNEQGQLIKVDGCPIIHLDTVPTRYAVEMNVDYIRRLFTVRPPKTKIHIWINGEVEPPALEQITQNSDSLYECEIKGGTTAYIFELKDTLEKKCPVLWSINDSLSGKILKTGKIIDRFNGK